MARALYVLCLFASGLLAPRACDTRASECQELSVNDEVSLLQRSLGTATKAKNIVVSLQEKNEGWQNASDFPMVAKSDVYQLLEKLSPWKLPLKPADQVSIPAASIAFGVVILALCGGPILVLLFLACCGEACGWAYPRHERQDVSQGAGTGDLQASNQDVSQGAGTGDLQTSNQDGQLEGLPASNVADDYSSQPEVTGVSSAETPGKKDKSKKKRAGTSEAKFAEKPSTKEIGESDAKSPEAKLEEPSSESAPESIKQGILQKAEFRKPITYASESEEGLVYKWVTSDYIVEGLIPLWVPPTVVATVVLCVVFGLPVVSGGHFPLPTSSMVFYFTLYIVFDFGLTLILGVCKWKLFRYLGFSHDEVDLLSGPTVVIPTKEFLRRGGQLMYQFDSYGRKFPHILHWAGLAQVINLCTTSAWSRFQVGVMGAVCSIIAQVLCYSTTNFYINMWIWLYAVRTGDGYARRMNSLYCSISSVIGMGVIVPLCSSVLATAYGSDANAFLNIITIPCAYGDCLAEIVGVNGVMRFPVYGIGEINNKSVEGMIAMFLGSVIPCLPYSWAVGGWPYLCFVGVLATIAETWSPRGTDNVFIPLCSALGVLIACHLSGVSGVDVPTGFQLPSNSTQ